MENNKLNTKEKILFKYLDIATQNREFEIKNFWVRTIFFGGIVSIAFTGLTNNKVFESPLLKILVSSFGVVCSFCWVLANLGAKFWQNNWEEKANLLTNDYFKTIEIEEKFMLTGPMRYSVSKLITLLSYFVLLGWYSLFIFFTYSSLVNTTNYSTHTFPITISTFIITNIAMFIIAWFGRSGKDTIKDKDKSKKFHKELGSLLGLIRKV